MKKRTKYISFLLAGISLFGQGVSAAEISTNAALMQAMDKVTGRVNKITVPVNTKVSFGDFSVVLRACKKRPAEEAPENFAFIDAADKSFGTEEYNIFRGWVLSSAPGINAIEHPIYDVWLLECIDTQIDSATQLSREELQARDALPTKDKFIKTMPEETKEKITEQEEPQKVIRIKEFIQEDRDIEKDIKQAPAYISEPSAPYISDIEEGEEPENLLQFTKMQELKASSSKTPKSEPAEEDNLIDAIDAEIKGLKD